VIATATTEFIAQCLEPEDLSFPVMPPFGSWVMATDEESGNQVFGVVYYATTAPIDSVHKATALGLSLQELQQQQPQIFAMLKTEFHSAIVGFTTPQPVKFYQYLPPRPPQIHQAVYRCDPELMLPFTDKLDFFAIAPPSLSSSGGISGSGDNSGNLSIAAVRSSLASPSGQNFECFAEG
jgi:hypothetical protein